VEIANALDKLVNASLDAQNADAETLELAHREMKVAAAAAGEHSTVFFNALVNAAITTQKLNHLAEARVLAEQAYEISQKEHPDEVQFTKAADALADICQDLGDVQYGIRVENAAIAVERKSPGHALELVSSLSRRSELNYLFKDEKAAGADLEEALAVAIQGKLDDLNMGIIESDLGAHYVRTQQFEKAIPHVNRALELIRKTQGEESPALRTIQGNLADLYSRTGQFELAWKSYKIALDNPHETFDGMAWDHAGYSRSLANGGELKQAIAEGLVAAKMGRESFVLQARALPERQALAYERHRPWGLNIALSVLAHHPELSPNDIYQEVVRSRALVADEMARRQRNLNSANDPEVAKELDELSQARIALFNAEGAAYGKDGKSEAVLQASARMEKIERALAEKSAAIRNDSRAAAVQLDELRRNLPAHSALISYVVYKAVAVEKVDPARSTTPMYMAFVLGSDSDRVRVFNLGAVKPADDLVKKMRASADNEAHSSGQGSLRNERLYRESGVELRKLIWDPLADATKDAQLLLVVPDGLLNIVPFAALPDGEGYLVERDTVVHILTSERDLLPEESTEKKTGLLVLGGPAFDRNAPALAATAAPSPLRGDTIACDDFQKLTFAALPGAGEEAQDLSKAWKQWNGKEGMSLLTGVDATRDQFLAASAHNRMLHIATHAFILNRSCGNGNPLLHSGLVFAGANSDRQNSILTAEQIASLDLNGVDWAVLSACNTGNGVLADGEGVLGLERAFRVAGARSVVMSLWPVDDAVTRQFMNQLYRQRFEQHASTADAAWSASRSLLQSLRTSHQSTHPWYWAGFVAAGEWR
jgi:CHAT domain-containing protein